MHSHEGFLSIALDEARIAAKMGEVPVGAVAVHDGAVIARAGNRVIDMCDPTAHAEILVLRQSAGLLGNYRLNGVTIYATLEPCPMCISALVHARVSSFYYGASCDKWGYISRFAMDVSLFGGNLNIFGGYRKEECASLLSQFFAEKRNLS